MAQFRTKARAVELLGKGQIADLPTAISELWKNGYDAYADKLECDLYLKGYKDTEDPVFVLSDTGFGMSREDILNKWIVLGTDSKARGMKLLSSEKRFGLKQRIPMGEKGIGRLSVSYLGSPMLMLTKKKDLPCQAIFFDWRILENYNLFVDDVNIPICEFIEPSKLKDQFNALKAELSSNFTDTEAWTEQVEQAVEIQHDILCSGLNESLVEEVISPFYKEEYHGTSFIVFRPHEQLLELSNKNSSNDADSVIEIRRSLGALFNIFVADPDFTTEFNIKDASGSYNIVNDFFDKTDFTLADHYIKGHFDDCGFFEGTIRVYSQTFEYKFRPIRLPGKTPYGAFDIELGVIEGFQTSSMLNPEQYAYMDSKTSRFGGLYIYRDNFRVLPYGRVDYDFLKFEERRAKRMGEYFFRYNKMYGYLGISREGNRNLTDKAGREGLVENKAYREFKQDLIAFFVDLARTYFSTPDKNGNNARSEQQKAIKKKNEKMAEEEKKNSLQVRKAFMEDLKNKTADMKLVLEEIKVLNGKLDDVIVNEHTEYQDYKSLDDSIESVNTKMRRVKTTKPQRINLTARQEEVLLAYKECYESLKNEVYALVTKMETIRRRFSTEDLREEYLNKQLVAKMNIGKSVASYRKQLDVFRDRMQSDFSEEQKKFQLQLQEDINNANMSELRSNEDYQQAISKLFKLEDKIKDAIDDRFSPLTQHLSTLTLDVNDDTLMAWYKEQKAKVDEKLEFTTGLAQLGISVEIIDHELNVLYAQMASSVRNLGRYAQTHTEVSDTFHQIRNAFEHLEQNYKMLKPLYRNVRRLRVEFTGEQVLDNIRLFFASKIKDLNVDMSANEEFYNYKFFTFESELISVFINIINNALYWVVPVQDRKIRIEYDPEKELILIMNNGLPIPDAELGRIFTLFYTKRKDGRGIGLYLAQKSLSALGFRIFASNASQQNKLGGACFVIGLN